MSKQQTNTVAACESVLANLQTKRARLVERSAELDNERRSAAYHAHVGHDAEARRTLDKVNGEVATHASELQIVDDAIAQAKSRISVARQDEAKAADRAAAGALRKELATFREHGKALDETAIRRFGRSAALAAAAGAALRRSGHSRIAKRSRKRNAKSHSCSRQRPIGQHASRSGKLAARIHSRIRWAC
jgi:hypothetical protein